MGYIVVSPGDKVYIEKNKAKDFNTLEVVPEGAYEVVTTDNKQGDGTYAFLIKSASGTTYSVHPGQISWIPHTGGWKVVFDENYLPPELKVLPTDSAT